MQDGIPALRPHLSPAIPLARRSIQEPGNRRLSVSMLRRCSSLPNNPFGILTLFARMWALPKGEQAAAPREGPSALRM